MAALVVPVEGFMIIWDRWHRQIHHQLIVAGMKRQGRKDKGERGIMTVMSLRRLEMDVVDILPTKHKVRAGIKLKAL